MKHLNSRPDYHCNVCKTRIYDAGGLCEMCLTEEYLRETGTVSTPYPTVVTTCDQCNRTMTVHTEAHNHHLCDEAFCNSCQPFKPVTTKAYEGEYAHSVVGRLLCINCKVELAVDPEDSDLCQPCLVAEHDRLNEVGTLSRTIVDECTKPDDSIDF